MTTYDQLFAKYYDYLVHERRGLTPQHIHQFGSYAALFVRDLLKRVEA